MAVGFSQAPIGRPQQRQVQSGVVRGGRGPTDQQPVNAIILTKEKLLDDEVQLLQLLSNSAAQLAEAKERAAEAALKAEAEHRKLKEAVSALKQKRPMSPIQTRQPLGFSALPLDALKSAAPADPSSPSSERGAPLSSVDKVPVGASVASSAVTLEPSKTMSPSSPLSPGRRQQQQRQQPVLTTLPRKTSSTSASQPHAKVTPCGASSVADVAAPAVGSADFGVPRKVPSPPPITTVPTAGAGVSTVTTPTTVVTSASEVQSTTAHMLGTWWRCIREQGVAIRSAPDHRSAKTGGVLAVGTPFCVSEEHLADDAVLYLRLMDGEGWVFEGLPGWGAVCERCLSPAKRRFSSPRFVLQQ